MLIDWRAFAFAGANTFGRAVHQRIKTLARFGGAIATVLIAATALSALKCLTDTVSRNSSVFILTAGQADSKLDAVQTAIFRFVEGSLDAKQAIRWDGFGLDEPSAYLLG